MGNQGRHARATEARYGLSANQKGGEEALKLVVMTPSPKRWFHLGKGLLEV